MHYLVNFVGDLLALLIILQYLSAVSEKIPCYKRTRVLVTTGAFAVLFFGSNFVFYQSPFVFIFSIVAIVILNLMYETKWYIKILHTTILYFVMGIPEIFTGMAIQFLDIDVATSQDNIYIYTICNFTSKLISFFIVRAVKLFAKEQPAIEPKSVIFLVPLPIATILMMLLFLRTCFIVDDTYYQVLTLLSSVALVFANLSIFFFIDRMNDYTEKKMDLLLYETQYKAQKQYLRVLCDHFDENSEFRHNAKNQLLVVMGLLEAGETQKASESLRKSLNILSGDEQNIINSGHLILDVLLQTKINEQQEKGVIIEPLIKIAEDIKVNEVDLGILLGNVLDNAIEGTHRTSEEKRIPIEVKLVSTDGYVSVGVCNAVDYEVDTTSLHTIKKNKIFHGKGVKAVKDIAHKYSGNAEFKCEGGVFSVNVLLENRGRKDRPHSNIKPVTTNEPIDREKQREAIKDPLDLLSELTPEQRKMFENVVIKGSDDE